MVLIVLSAIWMTFWSLVQLQRSTWPIWRMSLTRSWAWCYSLCRRDGSRMRRPNLDSEGGTYHWSRLPSAWRQQ